MTTKPAAKAAKLPSNGTPKNAPQPPAASPPTPLPPRQPSAKAVAAAAAHAQKQKQRAEEIQRRRDQEAAEKAARVAFETAPEQRGLTHKQLRAAWQEAKRLRASENRTDNPTTGAQTTSSASSSASSSSSSSSAASSSSSSSADLPLPATHAWSEFNLHPSIVRALLFDLKFTAPTPVQQAVLTPAIRDWKDISAAAVTGSGKTLAFGIPIIHRLLSLGEEKNYVDPKRMQALILTPTRELAMQIEQHLRALTTHSPVSLPIASLVGGMSLDKQKRVLETKHPAIVVATPGRLWELLNSGETLHLSTAYYLRFLVLDEADRMVDSGHFRELESILQWVENHSSKESMREKSTLKKQLFDGIELEEDSSARVTREISNEDEEQEQEEAEDGDENEEADAEGADEDNPAEEEGGEDLSSQAQSLMSSLTGVSAHAHDLADSIDWDSFLSEEEIFAKEGRKVPAQIGEGQRARKKLEEAAAQKKTKGTKRKAAEPEEEEEEIENQEEEEEAEENDQDDDEMGEEEGEEAEEMEEEEAEENEEIDDAEASEGDEAEAAEDEAMDDAAEDGKTTDKPLAEEEEENEDRRHDKPDTRLPRQIFLFSATLMLSPAARTLSTKSRSRRPPLTVLDKLASLVSLQPKQKTFIVDLSTKHHVASTLSETKLECLLEDKDFYVYYFLLLYPGKTIIFVNAISCLRRLVHLLTILKLPAFPLHAEMQQKSRLKSLDRFKSLASSILICTDVASRGIDIPSVPYIIHYQLPRTAEIYIHRCGRAARAGSEGLAFALVSAQELKTYNKLMLSLKRPSGVPSLQVDAGYMRKIKERMGVARELDKLLHAERKEVANTDWFLRQAEAMDIVLDVNELQLNKTTLRKMKKERSVEEEEVDEASARSDLAHTAQIGSLRARLDGLLSAPLLHGTFARKFYTLNRERGFDLNEESENISRAGSKAVGVGMLASKGPSNSGPKNASPSTAASATEVVGNNLVKMQHTPKLLQQARQEQQNIKKQQQQQQPAFTNHSSVTSAAPSSSSSAPSPQHPTHNGKHSASKRKKHPQPPQYSDIVVPAATTTSSSSSPDDALPEQPIKKKQKHLHSSSSSKKTNQIAK